MTKTTSDELGKLGQTRKETALEKTTRAAREILEDEGEQRRSKTEQLRAARLQAEAAAAAPPRKTPKKPR